jgi:hypothetical protein
MTRKIQISESDFYNIIKRVLLEQEKEKKKEVTFTASLFKKFISSSKSEQFIHKLNSEYEKVVVSGNLDLDLSNTPITSLPDNLHVSGYLNLQGTQITSLPDNLHVRGWLDLDGTPITSLPDNLYVGGFLWLRYCKNLTSLPDNLHVGGDLFLGGTPITSLPDNLVVGDDTMIYIYGTPLNDNDELIKEYEAKGYMFDRNP